ncbi:MAG: SusD/RagB family nutrient-binding outer membrane lipoprotein [bacterium]
MKKVNIKIFGVFVLAALIFTACDKWIDTDININPDAPSDVPIGTILPAVQANMAYNTVGGNDICRVTGIWLQYIQGIARQSQSTAGYYLREGDVNNQWNTNYSTTMMDLKKIMEKATGTHPHYLAVAQILMANSLGICTDFWNDIPYTEAFQGVGNLQPKFDTQEQIYQTIQALLDEAIANLDITGNFEAVGGDMMYGGDLELWKKAAYAFKARYALHLVHRDANAYLNVLNALPSAFASNDDDLQFNFGVNPSEENPLWQFMNERGDISMHATFIDMLILRQDPRILVYAYPDAAGGYSGNGFGGTSDQVSMPGPAVADPNSPVPFISYAECLFMQAEAEFMTGAGDAAVRASILAGVTASMEKHGVLNPLYIAAYDSVLQTMTGPFLFNEVMTQKYIALYYQAEPFNDWRRTGLPYLVPNPDGARPEIPRRYPYPTDEISYNPNTPEYGDIWNRVWWDVAPVH